MEKGGKSRNPLPYQIQKEESGQGWPPDLYAVHSCGRGSFHAGFGILKNHATVRGCPQEFRRLQKHVRSRFAMLHLIRRQNHIKKA